MQGEAFSHALPSPLSPPLQAQDKAEPGGQGLSPGSGVRDTPPLPSHRDTPHPQVAGLGPSLHPLNRESIKRA